MDKWKILGISKTKDKDAIKNAYRSRLVDVNPEDNSEGFMLLRKAYEDALYDSDIEEEEQEESALSHELKLLYQDFDRRIDDKEWMKLFGRDEFVSLDTSDESMHVVLDFLMNYNFIPDKIFKLIADMFNIEQIKDELSYSYPENFIDFILNNARYKDSINYYLFDNIDDDIDEFIRMYYRLDDAVNNRDIKSEEEYLKKLDEFNITHPYVEINRLYHEMNVINSSVSSVAERAEKYADEIHALFEKAEALLSEYKDDINIIIACGDLALFGDRYLVAEKYYLDALSLEPDNYTAKSSLGDVYCLQKEYEKARDVFLELLDINPYNTRSQEGLMKANSGLLDRLLSELEERPDDNKLKLELAWCYYRNDLYENAIEILEKLEYDEEDRFKYYDLLGRNYLYSGRNDEALRILHKWHSEIVESDDKDIKKTGKYERACYFMGRCYLSLKNYDEARKYLDIVISEENDMLMYAYGQMCRLCYEIGNYDECISVGERLLKSDIKHKEYNYSVYMYMAKSFDELEEYSRAIASIREAMKLSPYDSEPYALETRIYWYFKDSENMKNVLERFDRLGYTSDQMEFYRAAISSFDENYEASNEIAKKLLDKKGSKDTDIQDYFDVYVMLVTNYENMDDAENALYYISELAYDEPFNYSVQSKRATLNFLTGRFEEACLCFDKILELDLDEERQKQIYKGKASALLCMNEYEKAEKIYRICEEKFGFDASYVIDHAELLVRMDKLDGCVNLLEGYINELEDEHDVRVCIGNLCCFYGNEGRIDDAYRMFELARKKDENDFNIYRSMGMVCLEHDMYDEARSLLLKGIELDTEKDSFITGLYLIAVSMKDDVNKPEYSKYIEQGYEQFEKYDTEHQYIKIKLAEFYRGIGRYEDALALLDCVIADKPERGDVFIENPDAWCEKGHIYETLEQYDRAIECYRRALQIFGHNALYGYNIKRCEQRI